MAARELEIHAGHWRAENSGANGILNEVRENRRTAKRVFEILQKAKVPSTYFEDNSSTNQRDNINTIIKHHNADRDGLIVSFHFNASGAKTDKPIGTEVLYTTQKSLATELSQSISDATGGGLLNRGAKYRDNLGVLSRTYEPAVLIEVCFVNSSVDAAIYNRDFEKICQAIAKVLAKSIGYKLSNTTTAKEDDEMTFSSPALQAETEFSLASRAHREFIVKTAIAHGANEKVWMEKLENNTLTEGDLAGLAIKAVVGFNKGEK